MSNANMRDLVQTFVCFFPAGKVVDIYSKFDVIVSLNSSSYIWLHL